MQAELDVADVNSHQLMLKKGRPTASLQSMGQDRTATVNDQLIVSCISFGSTQTPNVKCIINKQVISTPGQACSNAPSAEPLKVESNNRPS